MGMNNFFNDTVKMFEFAVNARDKSSTMLVEGIRCLDVCPDAVEDEEDEETTARIPDTSPTNLWSDEFTWTDQDGVLPTDGDDIIIPEGKEIIYDIGTSPVFKSIIINGKLSFLQGQPAVLNTYALWVRAGELEIGTEAEPFNSTVEIKLHGNNTSPSEFSFNPNV